MGWTDALTAALLWKVLDPVSEVLGIHIEQRVNGISHSAMVTLFNKVEQYIPSRENVADTAPSSDYLTRYLRQACHGLKLTSAYLDCLAQSRVERRNLSCMPTSQGRDVRSKSVRCPSINIR